MEEAIRARNAETRIEEKIAELTRRGDRVKRKLDKTIDALLDAEELSPALRARAGELQNEVAELDREIAAETATLKGRTAVGDWREAKRYLLDIDIGALWMASTVEEQRELLDAVFRKIEATPDRIVFYVNSLEFPCGDPLADRGCVQ